MFKFKSKKSELNSLEIRKPITSKISILSFYENLDLQTELHCTTKFTNLKQELLKINNIILQKDLLISLLLKNLGSAPLPILSLLQSLYNDLQSNSSTSLLTIIDSIVILIQGSEEAQVLELSFTTLFFLIKSSTVYILANFNYLFILLEPLLRVKTLQVMTSHLFSFLKRHLDHRFVFFIISKLDLGNCDGVALLFFELLKQPNSAFYSRSSSILSLLLNSLDPSFLLNSNSSSSSSSSNLLLNTDPKDGTDTFLLTDPKDGTDYSKLNTKSTMDMVEALFMLIGHHGSKTSLTSIFDFLYSYSASLDQYRSMQAMQVKTLILKCLFILVGIRNGERVGRRDLVFGFITHSFQTRYSLLGNTTETIETIETIEASKTSKTDDIDYDFALMKVYIHLLTSTTKKEILESHQILHLLHKSPISHLLLSFISEYKPEILAIYVPYFEDVIGAGCVVAKVVGAGYFFRGPRWGFITDRVIQDIRAIDWSSTDSDLPGLEIATDSDYEPFKATTAEEPMTSKAITSKEHVIAEKYSKLDLVINNLYSSVTILSGIEVDAKLFYNTMKTQLVQINKLINQTSEDAFKRFEYKSRTHKLSSLAGYILQAIFRFAKNTQSEIECEIGMDWYFFTELLQSSHGCVGFLRGFKDYLTQLPKQSTDRFEVIYSIMKSNVGSFDSLIRGLTFEILLTFEQPRYLDSSSPGGFKGPINLFQICLDLEMVPKDALHERSKPIHLRRLESLVSSQQLPSYLTDAIPRLAFALFGENFAPLWPEVTKTLGVCALNDCYWLCFKRFLHDVDVYEGVEVKEDILSKYTISRFGCPSIHAFNQDFERVVQDVERFVCAVDPTPRVDTLNIYTLAIKSIPQSILSHHSSEIVGMFFDVLAIDPHRAKIQAFLHVFAGVSKPRKLHDSATLYTKFLDLCANGDTALQSSALECILKWQYDGHLLFKDIIKGITSDCRDAISTFDFEKLRAIEIDQQQLVISLCLRLLYGLLVSKKGRSSSDVRGRRVAIFGFVARVNESERGIMLDLMFQPFLSLYSSSSLVLVDGLKLDGISDLSKQIGVLTLLEDFIKQLRILVIPCLDRIMRVLINLIHYSEMAISSEGEGDKGFADTQARQIRSLATKRLAQIFSLDIDYDFDGFVNQLFTSLINSRIERLEVENTQAASAILDLFGVWSRDARYIPYLAHNPSLLKHLFKLLSAKKVVVSVTTHVLSIIESVLDHEKFHIFGEWIPLLLDQCQFLLLTFDTPKLYGDTIPTRIIKILARLAPIVDCAANSEKLVQILVPFLKGGKRVPEGIKTEILVILKHYLELLPSANPIESIYFPILSSLFLTLTARESRNELLKVFRALCGVAIVEVCVLLEELNSWSSKRIDEPDFDRRFGAFEIINQTKYLYYSAVEWQPILYCLFYYVYEVEEFSIRTSAAFGITRFIERSIEFEGLLTHLLFPQLKRGIKNGKLASRQEFIILLGKVVIQHPTRDQFKDMVPLLGDINDDETNFFSNITHLQVHRRIKALRQLSQICNAKLISPSNIANIFISIGAHFIFELDKTNDHTVINEAVLAIQGCCSGLAWGGYYACLKRFMNSMQYRPELEKVLIRLIILILERFQFTMTIDDLQIEGVVDLKQSDDIINDNVDRQIGVVEDLKQPEDIIIDDDEPNEVVQEMDNRSSNNIFIAVTTKLIPSLQKLISAKNDETVPIRTPLAIAITKLLQQLPAKTLRAHLPKLLLTMCNILSSHLQSSRDSARSTLVTISTMLGSDCLMYIMQGLRTALKRGYQLHVLGYTLHAIMQANVVKYEPGTIDPCVVSICEVCIQDIFGETGKEREVQELRGKMREIRTTKSFETLEYLSKLVTFDCVETLLLPVKEQMLQSNQISHARQIEEVFRRIAIGLNSNSAIDIIRLMVFIQKLLTESLPLTRDDKKVVSAGAQYKHARVQLKRSDAIDAFEFYESNVHMFIEFGLFLLLNSLKRERITKSQEHLEMLDPLVILIGKSMYAKHTSISILATKIFCIISKWSLPSLESTVPVVIKRVFQLISKSSSTDSELIQAVFKLLTIVLRDCAHFAVPEKQIVALLALLSADLEDPEKQSTTFSLIRAILQRKIVSNEVYDLMDSVSNVLITSQSSQVRELCRHSYIQFLVEYPHGNARLRNQITHLISNLEYSFESGRISVLEVLNLGISKFDNETFLEFSDMLFLSVVMTLSNDDSAKCREMAGFLIKAICNRLDISGMSKPLMLIDQWFCNDQNQLKQVSCQIVGLMVDSFEARAVKWISGWIPKLLVCLDLCFDEWVVAAKDSDLEQSLPNWEIGYYGLKALAKFMRLSPASLLLAEDLKVWRVITELTTHPHQWIRLISSQLLGALFSNIDSNTRRLTGSLVEDINIESSFEIIALEGDLRRLSKKFSDQLDSDLLNQGLAKQIVKNLYFISKCLIQYIPENKTIELTADDTENIKCHDGLFWLCKRLAFLARADASKKRGTLLRSNVFQWFGAIFKHLPAHASATYLHVMVTTLYHTENDDTLRGDDIGPLKQLASEVSALLLKEAGTTLYVKVYQSVQDRVQGQRNERREARLVQAVTDPKFRAQQRLKKNSLKQDSRKRKTREFEAKKMKQTLTKKVKN